MHSSFVIRSLSLLLLAACALSACADDLPKATEITHMRVLGARTEVKGDVERSTPKPGETAVMDWVLAYPSLDEDDSNIASLFITCTAPTRFTGIPICQEFLDLAENPSDAVAGMLGALDAEDFGCKDFPNGAITLDTIGLTCVTGAPKLTAKIEASSKLDKKLVRGIICQNGTPFLDPTSPELFVCKPKAGTKANEREAIAVYGTLPIQQKASETNLNPSIADATFELREQDWNAVDLGKLDVADEDCAAAAEKKLVDQSSGRKEDLSISFTAKAREKADGELERMEFSAYATAGELERRFTVFEPEEEVVGGQLKSTLTWEMSKKERDEIGPDGKLVRFFFSVMDGRGGFDITSRAICVLP